MRDFWSFYSDWSETPDLILQYWYLLLKLLCRNSTFALIKSEFLNFKPCLQICWKGVCGNIFVCYFETEWQKLRDQRSSKGQGPLQKE